MKRCFVFLAFIVLISFGCAQKAAVQPEAQQPQAIEQPRTTEKPAEKAPEKTVEKVQEQKVATVESTDLGKESAAAEGKEGMFQDIHFDFDKYDVKDADKPVLKSVASWAVKNTSVGLSIEGHCDERGTNEYNLALGDRRAKATKDALLSLGVPAERMETISYGEEKPLCTEQTDECWAKNRRAHFVVIKRAGK